MRASVRACACVCVRCEVWRERERERWGVRGSMTECVSMWANAGTGPFFNWLSI